MASKSLNQLFKKRTFTDKIQRMLLLLKTTDSEVGKMREQLINEAKPIYKKYLIETTSRAHSKLVIEHFDGRIRRLPKKAILELFFDLRDLKEAKSNETKGVVLSRFILHISMALSFEGKIHNISETNAKRN